MPEKPSLQPSEPQSKPNSTKPSKDQNEPLATGKKSAQESKLSSKKKSPKNPNLDVLPNREELPRDVQAMKRLGVDPSKIGRLPPINKLLKEQSKSGISGAIEAMRLSDGEDSVKFLEKYDSITERDRECLSIEIIAVAAGVNPRALLGEILLAAREYSVLKFKIQALEAHPDILEKRIEYAKLPGGYRDRDALDTILGALPRSKTTFIDKFYASSESQGGDTTSESDQENTPAPIIETEAMVEDENYLFPDSEVMQDKVLNAKQKLLEAKR